MKRGFRVFLSENCTTPRHPRHDAPHAQVLFHWRHFISPIFEFFESIFYLLIFYLRKCVKKLDSSMKICKLDAFVCWTHHIFWIFASEIVNCSYLNLSTISSESIWLCTVNYICFKLITNKMVMTKVIKLCPYYELLVGTGNNSHGTSFGRSISGTLGTYGIYLFVVFVSTC